MAKYRVEVTTSAERRLAKLPRADQLRVLRTIGALASEPRPPGSRKLTGYDDTWRVRVGVYRVIYMVEDERLVVLVLQVGQRKDV